MHEQHDSPANDAAALSIGLTPPLFSQLVSRGFRAAHANLVGAGFIFLIVAPQQIAGNLSAVILTQSSIFQMKPGDDPPPELFGLMGVGCFSCVWLPLLVFSMPWFLGGILGGLRSNVLAADREPFTASAKRYYASLLVLVILIFVTVLVIVVPLSMVVGAISGGPQFNPQKGFDVEEMQASARQPLNIAMGFVFGLIFAAMGVVGVMAEASLVIDGIGVFDAIGRAFRFCTARFSDAAKLTVVFAVVGIPTVVLQNAITWFGLNSIAFAAALGAAYALYLSYASVVNMGIGMSAYAARGLANNNATKGSAT